MNMLNEKKAKGEPPLDFKSIYDTANHFFYEFNPNLASHPKPTDAPEIQDLSEPYNLMPNADATKASVNFAKLKLLFPERSVVGRRVVSWPFTAGDFLKLQELMDARKRLTRITR